MITTSKRRDPEMEMGGMRARKVVAIMTVLVLMSSSEAQSTECVNSLMPCSNYLKSTTSPPASCCDPLKEVFRSDKVCLCSIFNNPSFLNSLGVTAAQASALPTHCNITAVSPNMCSSSPLPPVSSPATTPATSSSGIHLATPHSLIYIVSYLCLLYVHTYVY